MKGLKEKRLRAGMTLDALGKAVGLSLKCIFQYEKGARFPNKERLLKLSSYFKCTIDELL